MSSSIHMLKSRCASLQVELWQAYRDGFGILAHWPFAVVHLARFVFLSSWDSDICSYAVHCDDISDHGTNIRNFQVLLIFARSLVHTVRHHEGSYSLDIR
jgi:hypothetical protein